MAIKNAELGEANIYAAEVGIQFLTCDICGVIFSASMLWAWPFCSADIPHEKMEAKEQQRRQKLLAETPEKATASYLRPVMELYGPERISWKESDLPDFPNLQTVTLTKQKLKEFSDKYKIACEFIGDILGKHEWCLFDLTNFAHKAWFRPEQIK